MEKFTLSRNTILDAGSPEYFWINWMLGEHFKHEDICLYLIKAFGGDEDIANGMISVTTGNMNKTALIKLIEDKIAV